MWNALASNTLSLFIVIGVASGVLYRSELAKVDAAGPLSEAVQFDVEPGVRLNSLSNSLEEAGIISSARRFRVGARELLFAKCWNCFQMVAVRGFAML